PRVPQPAGRGPGLAGERGRVLAGALGGGRGADRGRAGRARAPGRRRGARPVLRRGAVRGGAGPAGGVGRERDRRGAGSRRGAGRPAQPAPVAVGPLPHARLVVADPPRAGLAREVIDYLGAPGNGARRFAYVSCDPATLARDIALLTARGWTLAGLRAFDAFPMTHHVECVATLTAGAEG